MSRARDGSAAWYERAVKLLPGGVNSPVRAMRSIGRDPIFIERGAGATVWDVDGNDYVDWVSSWGPLILGHALGCNRNRHDCLPLVHAMGRRRRPPGARRGPRKRDMRPGPQPLGLIARANMIPSNLAA